MSSRLIVALDYEEKKQALDLVDLLDPSLCALKVGNELFTRGGPLFVTQLVHKGFDVFLDLKFHDIPNTVARACSAAADLGVWMLNVHACGGLEMMSAAANALQKYGTKKPLLTAVTVLTSFDALQLSSIGVSKSLLSQVGDLALLAKEAHLDGVVCSAHEVQMIKTLCGTDFVAVTPGVRALTNNLNDQLRVMTPAQAIEQGSDYLVVGRPITRADNPLVALQSILQEMSSYTCHG